jgi:hypothetical protein
MIHALRPLLPRPRRTCCRSSRPAALRRLPMALASFVSEAFSPRAFNQLVHAVLATLHPFRVLFLGVLMDSCPSSLDTSSIGTPFSNWSTECIAEPVAQHVSRGRNVGVPEWFP